MYSATSTSLRAEEKSENDDEGMYNLGRKFGGNYKLEVISFGKRKTCR